MKKPLISIIIRTKNEERWIRNCLRSIYKQTFKNFEIILIDNNSSDKTLQKARQYKVDKILTIKKFLPGKALNLGIKNSAGKFCVCLSAHCIPKNKYWLISLLKSIKKKKKFAAVYGRQEPMSFSSLSDKRDLLVTFGLDEKIQKKDSFFHNANSIIKKDLLIKYPFDNKITNIEDRLWAQKILKKGYQIFYSPKASVYHYHGIYQDGNQQRLKNVVNIIEKNDKNLIGKGKINPIDLNIFAVIPIKGKCKKMNSNYLLKYTIDNLKKTKYIKNIYVSTDNKQTAAIAKKLGAECPFIRPKKLSNPKISLETVQQYNLKMLEKRGYFPDLYVHLEETFPFRSLDLIDQMIKRLLDEGYDTLIASKSEFSWIWKEKNKKKFDRIDEGDIPRKFKKKTVISLQGLGCVTYPEILRKGKLVGDNIGLFEATHPLAGLEIRDEKSLSLAENLLNKLKKSDY